MFMLSLGLVGMSLGPSALNEVSEVRILVGKRVFSDLILYDRTLEVEIVLKGSDLQGPLTALQAWFPGTELYDQDTPLSPEALQQAIGLQTSLDDIEDPQFSRLAKILRSRRIESVCMRGTIRNINYPTPSVREYQQNATDPIFSNAKDMCDNYGEVVHYNPTYLQHTSSLSSLLGYSITVGFVGEQGYISIIKSQLERKTSPDSAYYDVEYFLMNNSQLTNALMDIVISKCEAIHYVLTTPRGSRSEYNTQHKKSSDIILHCKSMMRPYEENFVKSITTANV